MCTYFPSILTKLHCMPKSVTLKSTWFFLFAPRDMDIIFYLWQGTQARGKNAVRYSPDCRCLPCAWLVPKVHSCTDTQPPADPTLQILMIISKVGMEMACSHGMAHLENTESNMQQMETQRVRSLCARSVARSRLICVQSGRYGW